MKRILGLVFLVLTVQFATATTPDQVIRVPMRDGYELEADLYLPKGKDKAPAPVVLVRSPRGKEADTERFSRLAEWGYAIVIQNTRSVTATGQTALPYLTDGWGVLQDGYDTVEWLAAQDFCNGKVATVGESALGITQLMLAPSAPPHLTCQYINSGAPSMGRHILFPGGQFRKTQVEGWLTSHSDPEAFVHFIKAHMDDHVFWDTFDATIVADKVQTPAFHVGGWFDTFCQGTLDGFTSRQDNGGQGAKGAQKLIVGPWTHMWPKERAIGDFDVPALASHPPVDLSLKTWLDHHLAGKDNKVEELPSVTYYVMGPFDGSPSRGNVWRTTDCWPVPSIATTFYLDDSARLTDNSLALCKEGQAVFTYDPNNPAPTVGGRNLFLEAGPKDQRHLENRDDVIVFTSQPLADDVEVTGRMSARVFFGTDRKDTDVVVKLCDVYPDGRSVLIADGIARLSSQHAEEAIQGSEPLAVDVDLETTSIVFAKGHSLRVSISSSNYPRYEKSLNVATYEVGKCDARVAHNTLYFGEKFTSRLVLPIVNRASGT